MATLRCLSSFGYWDSRWDIGMDIELFLNRIFSIVMRALICVGIHQLIWDIQVRFKVNGTLRVWSYGLSPSSDKQAPVVNHLIGLSDMWWSAIILLESLLFMVGNGHLYIGVFPRDWWLHCHLLLQYMCCIQLHPHPGDICMVWCKWYESIMMTTVYTLSTGIIANAHCWWHHS